MNKESNFNSMVDFFNLLNQRQVEYLVLRNYDNLLEDEIYMAGHGDVDMLCRNVKDVVDVVCAQPFHPQMGRYGDGIHFYFLYKGTKVSLDLRCVGDNYYCKAWENNMLKLRVLYKCFYVMDDENQLYSLIYHAIFQKQYLSVEYQNRLSMLVNNDGNILSEKCLIELLEKYMFQKKYHYVYAKDFYVRTRGCMIDKSLLKYSFKEKWPHICFETRVFLIESLVKIKHLLLGGPNK